jgi:threonylcarbamoyladenosine tRNA methylthiotransferase MtaB
LDRMRKRLKVVTVGCKTNFADSASIVRTAVAGGYEVVSAADPADVVVINSCTVTHRADRDNRSLIRRARRENAGAVIILSGCYARVFPGRRDGLPEVDHWIGPGNGEKPPSPSLAEVLCRIGDAEPRSGRAISDHGADLLLGHRRTFLKIQDGCDSACAYCVVPLARGKSRSIDEKDILSAASAAECEGARELVLTGIHIGRYGTDRGRTHALPDLIRRLLDRTSRARFRVGSVEPDEITDSLLALPASTRRVCPHLHVPVQSGCDRTLARMRRPYTPREVRESLDRVVDRVPGVSVGTDVMAGFPGETPDDFRETIRFLRDAPIRYLHAFSYSPRPGTESAGWKDDVPPEEKKRRVAELRALDREKREAYAKKQVGEVLEVLAERERFGGREVRGRSGNYLEVDFPADPSVLGDLLQVRIVGSGNGTLTGEIDG